MQVYMMYDTKDSDVCVAQFNNVEEIAKYFNRTNNSISSSICKKNKLKARYRIEVINI
jgi:hypothetical protein